MNGRMYGWKDEWMDEGWMDGWTNGWIKEATRSWLFCMKDEGIHHVRDGRCGTLKRCQLLVKSELNGGG